MRRWWLSCGTSMAVRVWVLSLAWVVGTASPTFAQEATAEPPGEPTTEQPAAPAPEAVAAPEAAAPAAEGDVAQQVRTDFVNFLQFANLGRFDIADKHAQSLLARPDIEPMSDEVANTLVKLADDYENSIETLLILINNSTIGENAAKVYALVQEAYRRQRKDPQRIMNSIQLLAGTPTQQSVGLQRLIDSGEYAIPLMLEVLTDPRAEDLHPFVAKAMPRIGKPAVNPLVAALSVPNPVIRTYVAEALGRIGYPQALPYLKRLAEDESANHVARKAAATAITNVVVADPKVKEVPTAQMFAGLAQSYYTEEESLRPDPRHNRANVWVVEGDNVKPIDVPNEVFCMVLSMSCCETSLRLQKDQPPAHALWLAANFRREARLGLDVQSTEAATPDDATRPANYPRSIYFARVAGPRVCLLTLSRALADRDRDVALGAIAALRVTAGPAALISLPETPDRMDGKPAPSLADALRFPDLLVRIRAALALGQAMPVQPFRGADDVVPVLASALSLTGQKTYLVVDPEAATAERIRADLTEAGVQVLIATDLDAGLEAAAQLQHNLDGMFLASDMDLPKATEAVRRLAESDAFSLVPVVLYVKQGGLLVAEAVADIDPRVGRVLVVAQDGNDQSLGQLLLARCGEVASRFQYREMSPEEALSLALDAAGTLHGIGFRGSHVFDVARAEPALTEALAHPSEELRIAAARVLALIDSPTAQTAIARIALSPEQTESLRLATFGALAESAKRFGPRLGDKMARDLIQQAMSEPNLDLRTAASQALGAMNLPGAQAVQTILEQPAQ